MLERVTFLGTLGEASSCVESPPPWLSVDWSWTLPSVGYFPIQVLLSTHSRRPRWSLLPVIWPLGDSYIVFRIRIPRKQKRRNDTTLVKSKRTVDHPDSTGTSDTRSRNQASLLPSLHFRDKHKVFGDDFASQLLCTEESESGLFSHEVAR